MRKNEIPRSECVYVFNALIKKKKKSPPNQNKTWKQHQSHILRASAWNWTLAIDFSVIWSGNFQSEFSNSLSSWSSSCWFYDKNVKMWPKNVNQKLRTMGVAYWRDWVLWLECVIAQTNVLFAKLRANKNFLFFFFSKFSSWIARLIAHFSAIKNLTPTYWRFACMWLVVNNSLLINI